MAKQDDGRNKLQGLADQIKVAEAGLRPHFENTPGPSPEVMARIKASLRSDAVRQHLAHRVRRPRLLRMGAIAAAIMAAAGLGLYFEALQPRLHDAPTTTAVPGSGMQASRDTESLDAFAASLSKVMSDEDPAVGELNSDLRDLESEHWSNG